ncbi:chloride channel protein CLC-c-like [Herrania umbratica]|uniref:Chloride channel protein CLC-c-like n=1 Tax=Herrania umbratica TaxID=108875 RepID=A0A6J1BH08_9ROSI|nr:chloride channel protein CLC-c-like [Herrania umbratica]
MDNTKEFERVVYDHEYYESKQGDRSAEFSDNKAIGTMKKPLLFQNKINSTFQIAIVGANACPIQSFDYEVIENNLFKQDWRFGAKVEIFEYVVLKWTLEFLIVLGIGLVAFCNNLVVDNIVSFKILLTNNLMMKEK